jgi:ketosteroid isomerase-like protein
MNRSLAVVSFAVLGAWSLVATAAEPSTTEKIVTHHMTAVGSGDIDAIVSDYADDAIVISPNGVIKGKKAIHGFFEQLIKGPNKMPPIELTKQNFEGDVGYVAWIQNAGMAGETQGSDTFVLHNGKIVAQTVWLIQTKPAK